MRMTKRKTRKKDGRKPLQSEKDKDPDLQGGGRKKRPSQGLPNFTQQQPDPEVENWKKHVKYHIFQHKFITAW